MPHSHALEPTSPAQLPLLQLGETCREMGGLGAPYPLVSQLPPLPASPPSLTHNMTKGICHKSRRVGKQCSLMEGDRGLGGGVAGSHKGCPLHPPPGPREGADAEARGGLQGLPTHRLMISGMSCMGGWGLLKGSEPRFPSLGTEAMGHG